jgi:hypothetical protein
MMTSEQRAAFKNRVRALKGLPPLEAPVGPAAAPAPARSWTDIFKY